ncbi:MBL fold metallo-hydrolase [Streptomyces sp. CBMA152]|uniref:MBL fold metallo-hydrolase n=1 Tax=Streptomyces sp. CBMA152 TaxID=1896312 RepID=UPI001660B790|nr:MBL fold metallo-hydrolase [Streptomyces sp. CBMA152]MBD0743135.1 MBL fold metallo-hydrolase [Streptomyces sp. CBMA152]
MSLPTALTHLAEGIHAWVPQKSGTWGFANCLVIASGTEAALVDTPYDGPMTRALIAATSAVLPEEARVRTVINTHANGDHTFGNAFFPDAEIISTRASLDHICIEPDPEAMHHLTHATPADEPLGWYMRKHFGHYRYDGLELQPPTQTFTGRHRLHIGTIPLELIEVGPAHTAGDLIVHLPEQAVVCAGDILFVGDHPVHWQGPLSRVADACETILALEPRTVVPGHGPIVGPEGVRTYLRYLRELEARIHAGHAAGRSAQATAASIIESGFHSHLGLAERMLIQTAVEYRHLDGDTSDPDLIGLASEAARWAFERRGVGVRAA